MKPRLGQIIMTASSRLTSVTMPAELGARVRRRLQQDGTPIGPIALLTRSIRWSFLVQPDIVLDTSTHAALFRLYVSVTKPGTTIVLPAPTDTHLRSWLHLEISSE
ncbi:hypothetical protein ABZV91_32510 [Nocardia sp. NPDC004568]|uniref:hypothetical protein n=1 Tax=Nocardia sp. NPDC004568 TaxID=3154551 RepID=UPI0033BD945B